ncbi:MAG: response regulator [Lachnospiraceae bacterium]|nr:response regulator [Lachnospiraceae bacterium]
MKFLVFVIQSIGIWIPVAGIFALLRRKHQSNNSMYLMVTNMGCLLMNSGYLLVLSAHTFDQAMIISKMQFLGNALFYFFFTMFIASYLWQKFPKLPFYIWGFFETLSVILYWNDDLKLFLFGDKPFFHFEKTKILGFYTSNMGQNMVYMQRYSCVCFFLIWMFIYSNIKMFRLKDKTERANMARLIGAQFVVMISLIAYMQLNPAFDFVPIFASLSILSIILSLLKDEFYGIAEMGHEWVFEQMEDAFIIVDKNYGFLEANSYAVEIFNGLKRQRKQKAIPGELQELFKSTEEIYRNSGKYYEKKIVDIIDKNEVVGYSMLLVDVTRQQELMEKVQEEKERADAANQAKSAFVSNVSHEIRTPMNAIVGMTQILLRGDLPEKEREYIVNIQNSGNALLTIINDILDMSKIESGKMELVEEDYDFTQMLNDLGMIILNRIGNKPVELIYDIDPALPDKLYGDALRIRQIIINLMNNATKFTEQGHVTLSVRVEKAEGNDVELAISVKDSGQGIREEDIPKLFGSFQQVDTKKNHKKEGTGLGLSICKQLVELMNGSIGVRSEYGKGSEFYFNIHQKLVSDKRAAQLELHQGAGEQILIAGTMNNEAEYAALQKLAEEYGLTFVPDILTDRVEKGKLYYFTDCIGQLSEGERKRIADLGAELCILQNPMVENEASDSENVDLPESVKTLNKPLFTYNFCQIISGKEENPDNQGSENEAKNENDDLSFTAPEARILIVDDNEINRLVAEEMLVPIKIQVDMAENGAEAVEKVQKNEYDIVLMDHIMPVMDGLEAAQTIRKLDGDYYKELPILALTANDAKSDREKYLEAGMNDFVAKPIMMEELFSKIRKWVPEEKIIC